MTQWREKPWSSLTWGCVLQNILDAAERLRDKAAVGREEIQERLAHLFQQWEKLKELASTR